MFVMLKCQNSQHFKYFDILEANRKSMDNVAHSYGQIVVCCSIQQQTIQESLQSKVHISINQIGEDRTRFIT